MADENIGVDDAAMDFASALSQFMGGEEPTPVTRTEMPPEEPAAAPVEAAPEPEATEAPEAPEPVEASPVESEPAPAPTQAEDKSWARLMSREQAFLEKQQRFEAEKAAFEASKRQQPSPSEDWQGDLAINPVQFLREHFGDSFNPAKLAEDLWFESMGADAPAHYHATKEARAAHLEAVRTRREMGRTREEQPAQVQTNQQQEDAALWEYATGLKDHAKSLSAEENPLIAAFVKTRGDQGAMDAMYAHAVKLSKEYGGTRTPTPAEVAASLTKELQELKSMFGVETAAPSQEAKPQASSHSTPSTLRNQHQSTQADLEAEDELSDEFLRRQAFEAMGRPDLIGKI